MGNPLAKLYVKSPRFGTNENVEITVEILENLGLADILLGNDLFQGNSKLRDQIEIFNFDVSASPVMIILNMCNKLLPISLKQPML